MAHFALFFVAIGAVFFAAAVSVFLAVRSEWIGSEHERYEALSKLVGIAGCAFFMIAGVLLLTAIFQ